MSLQVENSPFSQEQIEALNRLLPTLSRDQILWLTGYLTGLSGAAAGTPGDVVAAAAAAGPMSPAGGAAGALEVTVLFGSQTGTAAGLAAEVAQRLQQRGFSVNLSDMADFKPRDLKRLKHLLVVVSTYGDGVPPDNAVAMHEFLQGRRAPKLDGLQFSVLALGDITYEHYCRTGKEFDYRLEELGGKRLFDRVDCDVDYEEASEGWMEGVLSALCREGEQAGGSSGMSVTALPVAGGSTSATITPPTYSRIRPFQAEVLESVNLNGRGSEKETRHLELSLEDSGLTFEPGDSLGVCPQNHPELVDTLIQEMGWRPDEPVPVGKETLPLRDALQGSYEITVLSKPLLEQAAEFSTDGLQKLVQPERHDELVAYTHGRDLLDLVRDFSLAGVAAQDFVRVLRKLPPRLYSIANSCAASPDEVHLTIAAVRYRSHDRDRFGTCSVHCAERVVPGDRLPVYVSSNPNFRMPEDPDTPVIMIGPGTGVAPFRAFVEHREATGAAGKNWLFFGDQRFRTDFLYQTDWLRWLKRGVLTRMDVAFSRDTDQKVYVQNRMLENSRELFAWLEDGASVYVCGDEKRMAPDVHATLETIVEKEGDMTPDEAKTYVAELQQDKRYLRDVY